MAQDITNELNSNNFNVFKKDFTELMRVYSGINEEYHKLSKDVDKYIKEFRSVINLFNKKYKDLAIKLQQTTEELKLRIFIKEKGVKDVFINVASKLDGLRAIGATDFEKVEIEEGEKFSRELNKIKNKLFIFYLHQESTGTVFLEQWKKGIVELNYSDEIGNQRSPEFKLCAYYAVKNGIKKINIYDELSAMGFVEKPILEKVRNFFKKFNPRMEE